MKTGKGKEETGRRGKKGREEREEAGRDKVIKGVER